MRRLLTFILAICLCLSVVACSPTTTTEPPPPKTDPYGNRVDSSESGKTVYVDYFPCEIEYNGNTFELKSVDMYESYSTETYSYFLYAVARFDVSNLTDAQLHWLREEDIRVSMLYDAATEEDEYDFTTMSELGNLLITDVGELVYVFTPSYWNTYRDSFSGHECSLMVDVKQQETYKYDNDTDLSKEFSCFYSFEIPDNMPDSEEIEQPLYDYMAKWLDEDIELFARLSPE